jgi:hypothetical protein
MFIIYQEKKDATYAVLASSSRKDGKVIKKYINLGRVVDKEKGVYKNRERGVFTYDVKTDTYGVCPEGIKPPKNIKRGDYYTIDRKRYSLLILRFGDVFFLDTFLKQTEIMKVIDSIPYSNKDTLHALVAFYTLSSVANYHAQDWYELSYAKILYPNAVLSSQRISETLSMIGMEESKRSFFLSYCSFVKKCQMQDTKKDFGLNSEIDNAILIDSTGLPNDIKMPITGVNNHNGNISIEARLIYVVQQKTGLPLFFRYVSGNVIDASTVKRTIEEMKGLGINTKFALLDSGYYNGINADILIEAKISFITRVGTNHNIFKDAAKTLRYQMERKENLIKHNGRIYYIVETSVKIGKNKDHAAYGYFCLDTTMRNECQKRISAALADDDIESGELHESMLSAGLFMLVCTRKIEKQNLLGLYFTRNQVEEIFKIGKGSGKMLPICVESESTFRGHLMMTFITSVITKILMDKLIKTSMSPEILFSILQYQIVQIFPEYLLTSEPVKRMNEIYKHFKIQCPTTIEYKPTDDELKRMGI